MDKKDKIEEIREKLKKTNKPEEVEELLIQIEEAELEGITDHNKYAMKAAHIRDLRQQQMKHEAMRADEESEARFRKMMQMGIEKPNIEHKNITQEIIKNNKEIEEIKKHR